MSIFYNLSRNANDPTVGNKRVALKFESDEGNELLLDDQSKYQVGVARFKLPLNQIPLFRIYENDLRMCVVSQNGTNVADAGGITLKTQMLPYSVFGNVSNNTRAQKMVHIEHDGIYGIDPLYNNKSFVDLYSHSEFFGMMNRALAKTIAENETRREGTINRQTSNITATGEYEIKHGSTQYQNVGDINVDSFISEILTFQVIDPRTDVAFASTKHRAGEGAYNPNGISGTILTRLQLDIQEFTSTDANADFSDLDFVLYRGDKDGYTDRWFFNRSILRGVKPFAFDNTDIRKQLSIGLGVGYEIDAQTQLDSKLYDAYKNKTQEGNNQSSFRLYPSATDLTGVYGQRWDIPYSVSAAGQKYTLYVINNSYKGMDRDGKKGGVNYILPNARIKLHVQETLMEFMDKNTAPIPTIDANGHQQPPPKTSYLFPQFKYDEALFKGYLSISKVWTQQYGLKLLMNRKLKSLMNLDEYRIQILSQTTASNFIDTISFTQDDHGIVYNFPARIDSLGTDENLSLSDASSWDSLTPINHYEGSDTRYARNFLDSIMLLSGSIATQGEIVGNGAAIRKVITDFVADPSINFRDYVVFHPHGSPRYYPLVSTQPLYKVDCFVRYKDINGIVRPLEIEPSNSASIKLEFIPNNMVQNYIN